MVLSEFSETVLRWRSGDGVIPQVIEEAHGKNGVSCFRGSKPLSGVSDKRCMRPIFNDGESVKGPTSRGPWNGSGPFIQSRTTWEHVMWLLDLDSSI